MIRRAIVALSFSYFQERRIYYNGVYNTTAATISTSYQHGNTL